jgi:hypothetical protein
MAWGILARRALSPSTPRAGARPFGLRAAHQSSTDIAEMHHIKLHPAVEADAPAIAAIHVASWRDAYAEILA